MATFLAFSNTLPDPLHKVTDAGDISSFGNPGPGFSAINFQSVTDTQVSRTVSGRGIQRDGGSQHWEFTISYNPMFRYQFDPVDSFLLGRNPRKDPFYVVLPQHIAPKDSAFALFTANNVIKTSAKVNSGDQFFMVEANTILPAFARPGDVFTIKDSEDFNHQKVYKITGVEKNSYYQAGTTQPTVNQMRIRVSPPIQREVSQGSILNFQRPKFRVISKGDVQEHSINTDNLYSFSLAVEEIQP